jgi:hypothetical protein
VDFIHDGPRPLDGITTKDLFRPNRSQRSTLTSWLADRAQILMCRAVQVERHCIRRARMSIWNVSFYSSQLVQTCTCETQMAGLRFTSLLVRGVGASRV